MEMKNRNVEFDFMRIIACICVIMIHCAVFDQQSLFQYNTWNYQAFNFWGVISRWAVPAFVMLSGMFIIPNADGISVQKLLIKRVFRMLGAYIAWSCIYSAYNVFALGSIYAGTKFKTFIDGCFSGELHMWYLPMIAGLYIISPILAILVRNIDKRWTKYWIVMMFIVSSLIPFVVHMNVKFISVIIDSISGYMDIQFLGGWTLYFIIGYYIGIHEFNKQEHVLIAFVAFISFVFTMFATVGVSFMRGDTLGVLPYEYPNIFLMSVGIMVFFKDCISKRNFIIRYQKIIEKLSKLTFGIYLSHVLILKILYGVGINIQLFPSMISIPCVAVIVFFLGALLAMLLMKIPLFGRYLA